MRSGMRTGYRKQKAFRPTGNSPSGGHFTHRVLLFFIILFRSIVAQRLCFVNRSCKVLARRGLIFRRSGFRRAAGFCTRQFCCARRRDVPAGRRGPRRGICEQPKNAPPLCLMRRRACGLRARLPVQCVFLFIFRRIYSTYTPPRALFPYFCANLSVNIPHFLLIFSLGGFIISKMQVYILHNNSLFCIFSERT